MMNNQPGLLQEAESCIEIAQLVSMPKIYAAINGQRQVVYFLDPKD